MQALRRDLRIGSTELPNLEDMWENRCKTDCNRILTLLLSIDNRHNFGYNNKQNMHNFYRQLHKYYPACIF